MFKRMKRSHPVGKKKEVEFSGPIIVRDLTSISDLTEQDDIVAQEETIEKASEQTQPDIETKQSNVMSRKEDKNRHFQFEPNAKYFTICIYVLASLAVGMLIIMSVINLPFIVGFIKRFIGVINAFVVAFFIAFIINPIVRSLSDRFYGNVCRIRRSKVRLALGILTTYLLLIGLIVGFCIYVIPQISNSIEDLIKRLPQMYDEVIKFLNTLETTFPNLDVAFLEDKLNESMPQLIQFGTDFVKNAIPAVLGVSISIAKIAINILLSIAISIYMLYDKRALSKNSTRVIYALIPKKKADGILGIAKQCGSIFTNFIVGKALDSTIIGVICFIIMSILKLPYAALLSVIVGVTNMIPYFGPFIGAIPGVLLYLCIDPVQAFIFAILILAIQQFDGWILGPKILGDSTGLTPLWVIFGITVGGAYGGVFGMFIGVPIVAVVAYLADLFISNRLKHKKIEVE